MSADQESKTWVGRSVARREDAALLTGRGRFIDDLQPDRLLHAVFVRSPHAHARITGVDCVAARNTPGVKAVYAFADLPELLQQKKLPLMSANPQIKQPLSQPVLANDEVRYAGDMEQGFPDYEVIAWYGWLAPADTPQKVIALLHDEAAKAIRMNDVRERLTADGAVPVGSTPEEFARFIQSETVKWAKVVKLSGATAE